MHRGGIGDITTGAESDLAEASLLARRMITRWGMGKLGLVAFKTDQQQSFLGYELTQGHDYSETTAARIDEEVTTVLQERHEVVHHLLTTARAQLDQLAQTLLHEETLNYEALVRVLGPRPQQVPATQ